MENDQGRPCPEVQAGGNTHADFPGVGSVKSKKNHGSMNRDFFNSWLRLLPV
jgi:hypothetical protein